MDNRAVNKRMLENLIKCGAMDSFGYKRSELLAVAEQAMDMGSNYQKDYQSGQMGLFGDDSFADVNELRIPELEEIPKRTILQYEKELIGFYVTGNPLALMSVPCIITLHCVKYQMPVKCLTVNISVLPA